VSVVRELGECHKSVTRVLQAQGRTVRRDGISKVSRLSRIIRANTVQQVA
jgi:hypothetical protein